jgi:hypothetical protein
MEEVCSKCGECLIVLHLATDNLALTLESSILVCSDLSTIHYYAIGTWLKIDEEIEAVLL